MTPMLWSWLLSLTGAGLFFVAGVAFARARSLASSTRPLTAAGQLAQPDDSALREARTRITTLEREIDSQRSTSESRLSAMQDRIAELNRAIDADPARSGIRQELALSQETLRSRDTQLEHLREENARLRNLESELARTKRELVAVTEQTRDLRAQAFISKPPAAPRRNTKPLPSLSSSGRALQTIVDTEISVGGAKSAVIADELGLLVAASGATNEYNDALAAMGAYLADVGTKTRDMLPLHRVRQVVVRDDHDVTLTVRPLATDDPGLALVTLAVNADTQNATENRHN